MSRTEAAEILRIHISESDRHGGKPLYEAIVEHCRAAGIAGATVLPGLEGFGEADEMHRGHVVHSDRPVVVIVVDRAENIGRLMLRVSEMMDTGVMARSAVEMVRVEKAG